jgi:hypothetical protein
MFRNALLIGAATATLGAIAAPAFADNIVQNVWYAAAFTGTPSPLSGPGFAIGTNPPFGGTALAPAGTTWTITLTSPAKLIVTDVEASGDQFDIFDNAAILGVTSAPCVGCAYVGENISAALGNPFFSHGYFDLPIGVNVLSGVFVGSVGEGDVDFIVTSGIPEPAGWALMLVGVGTMGAALRSRRRTQSATA